MKSLKEMIYERIDQAKEDGFKGVEIDMLMLSYNVNQELLDDLINDGYCVIYYDFNKDLPPELLISWE